MWNNDMNIALNQLQNTIKVISQDFTIYTDKHTKANRYSD